MNLGFYVKSCNAEGVNGRIFSCLNEGMKKGNLSDASVFFDNIDHNTMTTDFGMFNSTEMWHFTGNLVTTSLETTINAIRAVNKFKHLYLYNPDDIDVLRIIQLSNKVDIITENEHDQKYVYRITGKKPNVLKDFTVESFAEVF